MCSPIRRHSFLLFYMEKNCHQELHSLKDILKISAHIVSCLVLLTEIITSAFSRLASEDLTFFLFFIFMCVSLSNRAKVTQISHESERHFPEESCRKWTMFTFPSVFLSFYFLLNQQWPAGAPAPTGRLLTHLSLFPWPRGRSGEGNAGDYGSSAAGSPCLPWKGWS